MKISTYRIFFYSKLEQLLLIFLFMPFLTISQNAQKDFDFNLKKAINLTENENDSALYYFKTCRKIITNGHLKPTNKVVLLEAEGNFQNFVKSNYNLAASKFLEAIKICEKQNIDYIHNLYHDLGVLFHVTDNYQKAKHYYLKAIPLSIKAKDTMLQVRSMVNLASIYSSTNNYKKANELYQKALSLPSTVILHNAILANLGNLKIREKKFEEAIQYLEPLVLDNQNPDAIDFSYYLDAKIGAKQLNGLKSILPKALTTYEQTTDLRDKSILLKSISEVTATIGDYKNALKFNNEYIKIYDSLKVQQRDDIVYDLETKYQTEKKQQEILRNKKEKQKLIYLIGFISVFVLVLLLLIGLTIHQKRTLSKQKKLLEIAVDEKNILLKETHHRVKNSFQIVSSLLYLQSENMKDKEAALAVKEAQNRVKSMVLIHQKLYSKDQLIGIDAKEYIEDLVTDIIENQTDSISNLGLSLQVESCVFSIDTITPLGLIINEVITNCIKHAFPPTISNPKIELEFKKSNDMYLLKVMDNGIGFSNEISDNSFGIKLITALAKKLKGKISFELEKGTHFIMEIHKFEKLN
ncbi:tetratricopeptide repeat-containing sensor histidine kinase [Flavobacterium stagni]|uniref:histidine kinase n=1 Tax=Flavobacterium stagni TaxID=2506421 RepID=A0A4Q1KBS8_9FLAO|nr:histidine kinase dimerization/phosphoacceptor domain -containing protein [Flavobacterium stagni]RXR24071.1 tetratricopeptide repeat protein [Flavobacterium stagni]